MRPEREKMARKIFWMVNDLVHACDPRLKERMEDTPDKVFLYIPAYQIKLFKEGLRYERYDCDRYVSFTKMGKIGEDRFMGLLLVPNFKNSIVIAHCDAVELGYEWMTASIEFPDTLDLSYQKKERGLAWILANKNRLKNLGKF